MFPKSLRSLVTDRSGAVMIYIGITIFVLFSCIGISIDAGRAFMARSKAMAALDASVLAAAAEISQIPTTFTRAETITALNTKANEYFLTNFPPGYLGVTYNTVTPVNIAYDEVTQRVSGISDVEIPMAFGAFHKTTQIASGGFSQVQRQGASVNVEIAFALDITPSMCQAQNSPATTAPAGCASGPIPDRNNFARQCTERPGTRINSLRNVLGVFYDRMEASIDAARAVGQSGSIYAGAIFFDTYFKRETGTPQIQNTLRENPLRSTNATINPWASQGLRYFDAALPASFGLRPFETTRNLILSRIAPRSGSPVAFMQCTAETQTQIGTFGAFQMLDPDMRRFFNRVRTVEDESANRQVPAAFGSEDTIKVLILMTDGNNTRNVVTRPGGVPTLETPVDTLANTRQAEYCETLKRDTGVVIYTIFFGLPSAPVGALFRSCASNGGDGYYFEANNEAELESAFINIADSIIDLRIRE